MFPTTIIISNEKKMLNIFLEIFRNETPRDDSAAG